MKTAVAGRSNFLPSFAGAFVKAESSPWICDLISIKIITLSILSYHHKSQSKKSPVVGVWKVVNPDLDQITQSYIFTPIFLSLQAKPREARMTRPIQATCPELDPLLKRVLQTPVPPAHCAACSESSWSWLRPLARELLLQSNRTIDENKGPP
jgi:hypothetical protein